MAEELENGGSVDWQKRCVVLEAQLFKFRLQAGKIRELLAEKMQELEQRVIEAEQRAENAEKQVRVMEEKLKSSNLKTSESDSTLYKSYQELSSLVQEKEEFIQRLESQLEKQIQVRAQEAKVIEEKAARIKEWVTFKLRELEVENYQLKIYNHKQAEQIQLLQDKLQVMESQMMLHGALPLLKESQCCANISSTSALAPSSPKSPPYTPTLINFLPSAASHSTDMKKKGTPGDTLELPQSCSLSPPTLQTSPLPEPPTQISRSTFSDMVQMPQEFADGVLHLAAMVTMDHDALDEKEIRISCLSQIRPKSEISLLKSSLLETGSDSNINSDNCSEYDNASLGQQLEPALTAIGTIQGTTSLNASSESKSISSSSNDTNPSSERDNSSEELNCKFRSQRLDSSSSSSETNMSSPIVTPVVTPKHFSPSLAVPTAASLQLCFPLKEGSIGNSMTLPKVRTPLAPRDSIQLVKKHYSQPQPGADRFHHIVNIDICSFKPILLAQDSMHVEETDIDDVPFKMETEEYEMEATENIPFQSPTSLLQKTADSVLMEPEQTIKPPTPPLHRFPSWESRIYAVAKSGMRLSEVALGNGSPSRISNLPSYSASGPFTHLIYKNVTVPVYTTLKGKATQISNIPFLDDSSGSDDDTSSHASFRASSAGSEPKKSSTPGSPRAVKRGVSMSSMSSESDYAIPPDAYSIDSDYSEPEHKLLRTSTYSAENNCNEPLEKSGYLLKMGSQVKTWKRRWFVLRNGEILYYKSPSDVIRKPQGQIELNSSCRIVRGEGSQTFQLITEKKTYYLTADSPNILEEWIRVLQNILKVQAANPVATMTDNKPAVKGWLTKVKHGHSKLVWCALIGKIFYYYRNHEDKYPLGHLKVQEANVEEVDRSCDSDEDYEAGGRGFLSSHFTLVIHPKDQSPTYLLIGTKQEKDTWLYHLTVAAGSSSSRVGTEYEQLIGKLMDIEGDLSSPLWKYPVLCYSKDGILRSLTTLPSEALQTEALKLFKSCQLFINVPVESSSIDYHVSLAQNALQVCLTHTELQNEIYCQLIKQTSCRQPQNYSLIQCWQLLALCAALFLPQHCFLWYLKLHLQRHADPRNEIGKYAIYCQRSVERTLQNGDREAKPSRMEVMSILLRNPYHHSLPFSIPVHFMNGTYQVVGFDGSTTVEEFLHTLNQETGMRKPSHSGFSLFTDDPSGKDLEHCLQGSVKICDVISKWEQALKELHPGKYEGTRTVRLTYKSRMYFKAQAKGETDRERLLLAYQINNDVVNGRFPVNKELALEVAALMAQVEYGDLERQIPSSPGGVTQSKTQNLLQHVFDKFYPKRYKQGCNYEQLRRLADRLATKWMVLRGCSVTECIRIYLTVARKWVLFGAKLFTAKRLITSYSYQSIMTFGGCRDDFMIVVSQTKEKNAGKKTIEKLVFTMAKPKIVEVTLLIASYINYCASQPQCLPPNSLKVSSPLSTAAQKKLWDTESQHFPSMTRTTKGPTLL
nr:PREDICTED: pleckstrin homology domain-containing family H member 1 [Latimeria chalumnae]|eukprot:XP_014347011.1 PREDICTED: pleckstrin homology domain-containing family H member 1 [Latimeria chalumnae]